MERKDFSTIIIAVLREPQEPHVFVAVPEVLEGPLLYKSYELNSDTN